MEIYEPICGRVRNLEVDLGRLKQYYEECVKQYPATAYKDNTTDYDGWAITSRTGEIDDNVRLSIKKKDPLYGTPAHDSKVPTPLYAGPAKEVLERLEARGISCFRARFLRLKSASYRMNFHYDTLGSQATWRLHIPIYTNPESYFQWQLESDEIIQQHLPADGGIYLVRVDVPHRAVNNTLSPPRSGRVHLIAGLDDAPRVNEIDTLLMSSTVAGEKRNGRRGIGLARAVKTRDFGQLRSAGLGGQYANVAEKVDTSKPEASCAVRLSDGAVLNESKSEILLNPAGISKLLLVAVLLEQVSSGKVDINTAFKIKKFPVKDGESRFVQVGDEIAIRDAISLLLLRQSNNVARALAWSLFADEENLAGMMTARARELGMNSTHFLNVTGIYHKLQHSTCSDIAVLARYVLTNFSSYSSLLSAPNVHFRGVSYRNRHPLCSKVLGYSGLIRGFSKRSGVHLVTAVERAEDTVIVVAAGFSDSTRAEARTLALIDEFYGRRQAS